MSVVVAVWVAGVMASGCAASRREAYVRERAGEHVYRRTLADVWPRVQEVLKENGYAVRGTQGGYELVTEWLEAGAPSSLGTAYARYLVRGQERGPGQCTVQFLKQNRVVAGQGPVDSGGAGRQSSGTDTSSLQQDLDMAWLLLQKLEPQTAEAWRAEAAQKFK